MEQTAQKELESLRNQLDGIDRQIVDLLSKRQAEVEKVVALKKKYNLPIYHPAREEDLISNRRQQGKDCGLDPDYIEEIYRMILRQSRVEQTHTMARSGIRPDAKVLILGGSGSMGKYFVKWFQDAGYMVRTLNSRDWANAKALCEGIDLAILSVPIDMTMDIAQKIGSYLPEKCVLTDLTSIKEKPLNAMLKAHNGPVVGFHPLFGPTTSTMDKQIVVVAHGRYPNQYQWVIDQFVAWGAIVVQADAKEHDAAMGIVQTLRHFATFAFGRFLYKKQVNLSRTLEFSSPIYRLELGMVGRLFAQDPLLYAEIIMSSEERRMLLAEYVKSLSENAMMIQNGDRQTFIEEFEKISKWFGPFSEQAMRESSFLIDKLIERF